MDGKIVTVKGILIPSEWDSQGNVLAVSVMDRDEEEYIVEQNEKGKELIGMIRYNMKVSGVVRKISRNRKRITVSHYENNGNPLK